jgi:hypothetical protein
MWRGSPGGSVDIGRCTGSVVGHQLMVSVDAAGVPLADMDARRHLSWPLRLPHELVLACVMGCCRLDGRWCLSAWSMLRRWPLGYQESWCLVAPWVLAYANTSESHLPPFYV